MIYALFIFKTTIFHQTQKEFEENVYKLLHICLYKINLTFIQIHHWHNYIKKFINVCVLCVQCMCIICIHRSSNRLGAKKRDHSQKNGSLLFIILKDIDSRRGAGKGKWGLIVWAPLCSDDMLICTPAQGMLVHIRCVLAQCDICNAMFKLSIDNIWIQKSGGIPINDESK